MNNLIRFLSATPEISNVVVVGGSAFSDCMLEKIIQEISVEKISFYFASKKTIALCNSIIIREKRKNIISSNTEYVVSDIDELLKSDSLPPKSALLFDALDDDRLLYKLVHLSPYCLCGALPRKSIGSFEVWEAYRKCCEKIYIITFGENDDDETLNWTRNKNSSVELSVIYPVYNVAKYLEQCIGTTTAWKADYVEFLFVDDGSPDNSAEIIEAASKKDPRIKLLRKENGGCASARQLGLDMAKGRYIGFVDPDDYTDSIMFHKLLRRAMTGNYDISYCGYSEAYTETGGTKQIKDPLEKPYISGTTNRNAILDLCAFCRVAIWRGIYSSDMIKRAKLHFYTDLRRFDDLPFKFETFATAKSVVAIPDHFYYYRIGRPGQDVSANDEKLYVHFPIFQHLDEFVMKHGTNKMMEMLQIVKLQTHKYALNKILPEYYDQYLRQAKKDLLSLYSPSESRIIYKKSLGYKNMLLFNAILNKSKFWSKILIGKNHMNV